MDAATRLNGVATGFLGFSACRDGARRAVRAVGRTRAGIRARSSVTALQPSAAAAVAAVERCLPWESLFYVHVRYISHCSLVIGHCAGCGLSLSQKSRVKAETCVVSRP